MFIFQIFIFLYQSQIISMQKNKEIQQSIPGPKVEEQQCSEGINNSNEQKPLSKQKNIEHIQQIQAISNSLKQQIPEGVIKLSKKQLKKQQQKQKWEQLKKLKRKSEREKQKIKRKQKKEEQIKKLQTEDVPHIHTNLHPKKRKDEYIQKMNDQQRVVIDLQFYDLMTEKEQTSLAKQLAYTHSVNRKMEKPFNFIITSITKPRLQFFSQKYNIQNYGIKLFEESILELFDHQKIIYLTGDAEEQINQLDPEEIYIIGGIVDHNRLKNITINYAKEHKIQAKRLPMDGVKLKASVHIAVNHVWEWLLRKYNGETWDQAIRQVIPDRKIQQKNKVETQKSIQEEREGKQSEQNM